MKFECAECLLQSVNNWHRLLDGLMMALAVVAMCAAVYVLTRF